MADYRPIAKWIAKAKGGSIEHAITLMADFAERVDAGESIPDELLRYIADAFGQILKAQPGVYKPPPDNIIAAALNLKHPSHAPAEDKSLRDLLLAILVKEEMKKPSVFKGRATVSQTQAIETVREDAGLSTGTVTNALKAFKDRDALNNHDRASALRIAWQLLTDTERETLLQSQFSGSENHSKK